MPKNVPVLLDDDKMDRVTVEHPGVLENVLIAPNLVMIPKNKKILKWVPEMVSSHEDLVDVSSPKVSQSNAITKKSVCGTILC